MKKVFTYLFSFTLLLSLLASCEKKEEKIIWEKGELVSAIYDAEKGTFTLSYDNGRTETIKAIINNTTIPPSASAKLKDGTNIYVEDKMKSGPALIGEAPDLKRLHIIDWIHDEMSIYYLWNDKMPKNPDKSLQPSDFFYSLLNTYHKVNNPDGDRFSWIQENYTELLKELSGVSSGEIGFEYILVKASDTQFYALVLYPKLGTDAEKKGIKRGTWITKVDGQDITEYNYRSIFSGTGSKTLTSMDWVPDTSISEGDEDYPAYKLGNKREVTVQMEKEYAENPVYTDSIYTIGDKKIGYLVYHFFAQDNGDKSNSYDKLLMERLSEMQSQGVTEMVLDLRYNSGGAVSSAIALSSALVKDRSTKNILVQSEYNSIVHRELSKAEGEDYNKVYFVDHVQETNIAVPSLNLSHLYILTGKWTASASEFVINGLKPYMDVTLIGETTYGKNVGSISIYEENDPDNKWGMQPIIVKYYNSKGESDFTTGFKPDYEVDEFADLYLFPYGDINDPLLDKAVSLSTGSTRSGKTQTITTPLRLSQIDYRATGRILKPHRFEMQDDIWGDKIKKLMLK